MTGMPRPLSLIPDGFLKFGIFLAPFHPVGENPTLAMERDMQLLEHLDMLGYDEAWIGEHHSGGFEIIACPEVFIAGAAARTRHIRLGTGVVSLPGMMTGQILAGVDPTQAVKYQLLIMFLIAGATGFGVLLAVLGGVWRLTDERHRLRLDRLAASDR